MSEDGEPRAWPAWATGPGAWLLAAGLVTLVAVVVLARTGTSGDPYDAVLGAAARSLEGGVAAEVSAEVDLSRLGELAAAEDGAGASLGLGLLSGRVTFDGLVAVDEEVALIRLQGRDGGLASVRLDQDRPPLLRLDADLVGGLPGGRLLAGVLPGVFGQGWVEIGAGAGLVPQAAVFDDRVDRLRDRLRTADRADVRERWSITRVGSDADGDRFRVVPGEDPDADDPGIDVWVRGDQVTRLRLDALPFLRAELFGVRVQGGDGGLLLDLRPVELDLGPRPQPGGVADLDALRRLLPS